MGQVDYAHGRLGSLMQSLEEKFADARNDRSDGLKLILPNGWIHVRASNTEPLLRLAAEARSQAQVDELYTRVVHLLSDAAE
jgi:phosphomannomutase